MEQVDVARVRLPAEVRKAAETGEEFKATKYDVDRPQNFTNPKKDRRQDRYSTTKNKKTTLILPCTVSLSSQKCN